MWKLRFVVVLLLAVVRPVANIFHLGGCIRGGLAAPSGHSQALDAI
jgi:hypothetical protein